MGSISKHISQRKIKHSGPLVIREMQVTTTNGYHRIPSTLVSTKRQSIASAAPYGWIWMSVQSLLNTVRRFLKNLHIDLPFGPTIHYWGLYPKKMRPGFQRHICTPMSTAALLTIAKKYHEILNYYIITCRLHYYCDYHITGGEIKSQRGESRSYSWQVATAGCELSSDDSRAPVHGTISN